MRRLWTLATIALISCMLLAMSADARVRDGSPGQVEVAVSRAAAPMIRISPSPGAGSELSPNANVQTANWSGYASVTNLSTPANSAVSDVTGVWVVPTVTGGATDAYCSDWIGIDGYTSTSVEQLGTEEDWIGGSPSYSAWWEMYDTKNKQPEQPITTMTINPGDVMSAEVRWVSGNTFTLSLTDVTTGATFTTQQLLGSTAKRSSAEWVHEAPSSGSVLPLAQTTPVTFTGCDTTINGTNGPINDVLWQNTGMDMVQNSTVVAQASGLSAGGTSFMVGAPGTLPHISASSASLTFNSTIGSTTPAAQPVTFTNTGGGTLSWSAASDSPSWLSCTPTSGSSGASTSVSVDPSLLAAGTYTGNIVVAASGADNTPLSIPVTLNVHPPPDTTAPTTTLLTTPTPNGAGWNDTNVLMGLHATDTSGGSGVAATYYTLDGGSPQSYTSTVTLSAPGTTTVGYWSVDASGNVEATNTATIRIDKTAPSLSLDATSTYTNSATIDATATDALSGLAEVDMRLDSGSWVTETQLSTSALGSHTVYARAFDIAGNESDTSATFTVVGPPPVPITLSTITKLAGPASVKVKKTLKLTGTISYSAAPGRVTITRSRLVGKKWKHVGSATVSVAGGAFSYSFKPGYRGSWRFVATYSGGAVGVTTYSSSQSSVKTVKVK